VVPQCCNRGAGRRTRRQQSRLVADASVVAARDLSRQVHGSVAVVFRFVGGRIRDYLSGRGTAGLESLATLLARRRLWDIGLLGALSSDGRVLQTARDRGAS